MQAFIPPVARSAFSPPPLQDARAVEAQGREATSWGHSPVGGVAAHGSSHQAPGQVDGLRHGLQGVGVTH